MKLTKINKLGEVINTYIFEGSMDEFRDFEESFDFMDRRKISF